MNPLVSGVCDSIVNVVIHLNSKRWTEANQQHRSLVCLSKVQYQFQSLQDHPVTLWPQSIFQCLQAVFFSPQGTKAGQPPTPPCRPGFSECFYTVFVSRDLLRGQSILKGKHCGCGGPGSHLLNGVSPSSPEIHPNQRVIECVCGRKYIMVCGIPS